MLTYFWKLLVGRTQGILVNYQLRIFIIIIIMSWQVVAGGTEGQLAATRWHWSAWIVILGERSDNDTWYWYWYRSIIINTMINSDRNSWWKERCVWYPFRSPRSRSSRCQLITTQQWAPAHHPWCRWVIPFGTCSNRGNGSKTSQSTPPMMSVGGVKAVLWATVVIEV